MYNFGTCFVMASMSDRKVMDTSRLKAQLTEVATVVTMKANLGIKISQNETMGLYVPLGVKLANWGKTMY
jgi:hypothetical protein